MRDLRLTPAFRWGPLSIRPREPFPARTGARTGARSGRGGAGSEIARRLGINRRTVARLARSGEPPRYRRAQSGSKLDPFEPVLRRLVEEWPRINAPGATELLREEYGYEGSVDLVKRRLPELRPAAVRPAQRTGYRPGLVLQLDWAEMPTRPTIAGRERRVYALVASLPYSGAQTAFFSFEMTLESSWRGTCAPSSGSMECREERGNVCFLGPPRTGKTHLATALGLKACERGYRVAFATRIASVSSRAPASATSGSDRAAGRRSHEV